MLKKKFKTRVVYFAECKYKVQYAHYRIIPIWRSLKFWFSASYTSNLACWSLDLFDVEEAERVAASFKSIEDVNEYYKPMEQECAQYIERRKEYFKKNAPYTTKTINNN